jgi:hypothetical protein
MLACYLVKEKHLWEAITDGPCSGETCKQSKYLLRLVNMVCKVRISLNWNASLNWSRMCGSDM